MELHEDIKKLIIYSKTLFIVKIVAKNLFLKKKEQKYMYIVGIIVKIQNYAAIIVR